MTYSNSPFNSHFNSSLTLSNKKSLEKSLENIVDKNFDPIENSINNLNNLNNSIPLLSENDIFDITTTGMPYYDAMIQKGHIAGNRDPVDYFKQNKGLIFEIKWMSPQQYLTEAYRIHTSLIDDLMETDFDSYIDSTVDFELVEQYKQRTIKGSKMPIPMLDYSINMTQEGRHRAMVAQQLDIELIPVLVVKDYK